MELFDREGTGVFDCRTVQIPMDQERLAQRATLSVYRLPWCDQFCFWLDLKPSREAVFDRLQEGFRRTGGAPHFLLVRRTPPFAPRRQTSEVWLRTFRRFCHHYRCAAYESKSLFQRRTPWYVQVQDTVADTDWSTVAHCQEALDRLAGHLRHGRESDAHNLLPLPADAFHAHQDTPCRVASDGFVRYEGDYYSVPSCYIGGTVWVRRTGQSLRFHNVDERFITQYQAGPGQGKVRLHLQDFRYTAPEQAHVIQAWHACFPNEDAFLSHLLAQRKRGALATLLAILDLTKRFRRSLIRDTFRTCEKFNNYSHRFILGLLEGLEPCTPEPAPPISSQEVLFAD